MNKKDALAGAVRVLDKNGEQVDLAIDAVTSYFEQYLNESNAYVSPMVKRIRERRATNGKENKPIKINSNEDIKKFVRSMREFLVENFPFRTSIVFSVDYEPMFDLARVIKNSGIEHQDLFIHRAKFMFKQSVTITHDKVTLRDGNKTYPDIWNL